MCLKTWKNLSNSIQKKTDIAILITDKVDFNARSIVSNKEGHILQFSKNTTVALYLYVPNNSFKKYKINVNRIKGETNFKLKLEVSTLSIGKY